MLYPITDDIVFIDGLRVDAVIGIYDWERAMTQSIVIDMALFTDIQAVVQSQDLSQGVNYQAVSEWVGQWVREEKFELLETLVETIAQRLLDRLPVSKITIKAVKPNAITTAAAVGVQITRCQSV